MSEAATTLRIGARETNPVQLPDHLEGHLRDHARRAAEDWCGEVHFLKCHPSQTAVVDLSSNDYLRLGGHPAVIEAKIQGLREFGNDTLMSAVFLEVDSVQVALERELAAHLESEAVILCQSGYTANLGLLQVLTSGGTPIYVDRLAHMSLWDGLALGRATPRPFRHNDLGHLERKLREGGPGVVVVDAVYSTNGSVCPLRELVDLAERYGCTLVVDESHSLGTHGEFGEGLVVSLGLQDRVTFRTASLSKAMGERGGLIACPERFVEWYRMHAHPAIFSTAVMSYQAVGVSETLRLVRAEKWRRQRLHANSEKLRAGLAELGYDVSESQAQIIALEAGSEYRTIFLRDLLSARGIASSAFIAPATGVNHGLVRLSLHCLITPEDIERVVVVCGELRGAVDLDSWPSTLRRRPVRVGPSFTRADERRPV